MSLIRNERTKYLATLLNTVAAATIAAGVIALMVALSFGVPGPIAGAFAILTSLAWLASGLSLHLIVRYLLGRLVP